MEKASEHKKILSSKLEFLLFSFFVCTSSFSISISNIFYYLLFLSILIRIIKSGQLKEWLSGNLIVLVPFSALLFATLLASFFTSDFRYITMNLRQHMQLFSLITGYNLSLALRDIHKPFFMYALLNSIISILGWLYLFDILKLTFLRYPYSEPVSYFCGTFRLSHSFAEIIVTGIFITYFLYVTYSSSPGMRIAVVCLLLLQFSGLYLSWSRISWLGCLVGSLLFFILKKELKLPLLLLSILTFLFSVSLIFFHDTVLVSGTVKKLSSSLNLSDTGNRTTLFRAGLSMIKDSPLKGHGLGGVNEKYRYYLEKLSGVPDEEISKHYNHIHNNFLQFWIEKGILGLASLIFFYFCIFIAFIRTIRYKYDESSVFALAVLCLVISFMIEGFFEYNFFNTESSRLLWMLSGFAMRKTEGCQQLPSRQ